jgi:hypothetical protein
MNRVGPSRDIIKNYEAIDPPTSYERHEKTLYITFFLKFLRESFKHGSSISLKSVAIS